MRRSLSLLREFNEARVSRTICESSLSFTSGTANSLDIFLPSFKDLVELAKKSKKEDEEQDARLGNTGQNNQMDMLIKMLICF